MKDDDLEVLLEDAQKAIFAILDWTEAYPEDVFPEQDLKRANDILAAVDISMSAMFGTWGRHITQGIAFQARAAQGALLGVQQAVKDAAHQRHAEQRSDEPSAPSGRRKK